MLKIFFVTSDYLLAGLFVSPLGSIAVGTVASSILCEREADEARVVRAERFRGEGAGDDAEVGGASSAPTPHGLLTRAAILVMIVLSNVQAQG